MNRKIRAIIAFAAAAMGKPPSSYRRWTRAVAAVALAAGTGLGGLATDSASAAAAPAALVLAPAHHQPADPPSAARRVGASYGWVSSNWSGYAIQTTSASPFHSVSGSWTVPAVKKPRRGSSGFSSAWVGLDGFFNSQNSLIQTGTEQDFYYGSGHYNAWWTTAALGYQEQVISGGCSSGLAGNCGIVTPGDLMTATVTQSGGITLSDASTSHGWSFTRSTGYSSPGLSAEWILEAPSSTSGVLALANYGSTTFDPGTVNGANPGLVTGDGGYLVQGGAIVSIPSTPDHDTDGFAIAYGSAPPSPPNS